ncbi:hypothetical protein [Algivirga pacifica]|uniref:Long-chain fatty acid transport protein n=1 Tax=Algivirga pacifica TaxID=1162670 RepID=A0ABP9DCN9_9BACT
MHHYQRILIVLSFLFVGITTFSFSQNHYYNSLQYGGRGALLGGAMLADTTDKSTIYYNPAATVHLGGTGVTISSNLYGYGSLRIKDGAGEDIDLLSSKVNIFPQLIAGEIPLSASKDVFIGYTLLTKHDNNIVLNSRNTFEASAVGDGFDTTAIASFEFDEDLFEQWIGLGVGLRVNEHWSVGLTAFATYRQHAFSSRSYVRVIEFAEPTNIGTADISQQVESNTLGFLWKFGLQWHKPHFSMGLTLTTPKLSVDTFADKGVIDREFFALNLDELIGEDDLILSDRQQGVKTTHRRPMELGLGAQYELQKTKLYLSIQHHFKQKAYQLLDTEQTDGDITGELAVDQFVEVKDASSSVTNVNVGVEHQLNKWALLGSFRTNFSAYEDIPTEEENNLLVTPGIGKFNTYYLTFGLGRYRKQSSTHFGIEYGRSFNKIPRFAGDLTTLESALSNITETDVSVNFFQLNLIVGYTHYIGRD